MGRPKLPKGRQRGTTIQVRVSPEDRDAIEEGARLAGASGVSTWLRGIALREARKLRKEEGD